LWELLRRGRADAAVYFAQRYGEFWPGPGIARSATPTPIA